MVKRASAPVTIKGCKDYKKASQILKDGGYAKRI
jgi:hypothetical protein